MNGGKEFRAWWKCRWCDAWGYVPVPRESWPAENEPVTLAHSAFALPALTAHDGVCPARLAKAVP